MCKIPKTYGAIYRWCTLRAPLYTEPTNMIKISVTSVSLHGHPPISVEDP